MSFCATYCGWLFALYALVDVSFLVSRCVGVWSCFWCLLRPPRGSRNFYGKLWEPPSKHGVIKLVTAACSTFFNGEADLSSSHFFTRFLYTYWFKYCWQKFLPTWQSQSTGCFSFWSYNSAKFEWSFDIFFSCSPSSFTLDGSNRIHIVCCRSEGSLFCRRGITHSRFAPICLLKSRTTRGQVCQFEWQVHPTRRVFTSFETYIADMQN